MLLAKRVLLTIVFIGLLVAALYVVKTKYADHTGNASEKTFQELQDELNKEKYKKKVVSRFEVIEGLRGLNIEDISLTLLEYSYHRLNDNGRRQPFVTIQCRINTSKFEKDAENVRAALKATGRQAQINIELPDSERTIVGLIDDVKDEFITLTSLPRGVKPVVQFAELRKDRPEFVILTLQPDEKCNDCDDVASQFNTAVVGFDEKNKTYYKVLEIKTYREVNVFDSITAGYGYADNSTVSWSDWINDEYRELIITTEREIMGPKAGAETFKSKKEIYSWAGEKELVLIERIVDGKSILNRREGRSPTEITLKDGELHELNGKEIGNKITSTGGKIEKFLLSPDKQYVAYSIIVGSYNVVGLDDEGTSEPVFYIVVMDLDQKKQLMEIEPQSEHEPFIYADRWISTDELILTEADGFATGRRYVYDAGNNELRMADMSELDL